MGQPVMQWQILARDPDKLTAFYGKLFGWRVNADNAMGYRMLDTGSDRGIKGGVWPIGDEGHPLVQLFVEVDDVPASAAQAEQLGGQVIIPPQVLPDGDEMAIVMDTEGLSFGLVKTSNGTARR
jgi:predicted enzyme related to lactoylglutathione lyase